MIACFFLNIKLTVISWHSTQRTLKVSAVSYRRQVVPLCVQLTRHIYDMDLFSACVAAVQCHPVSHHCVFFWSSGIMDCMLFTF